MENKKGIGWNINLLEGKKLSFSHQRGMTEALLCVIASSYSHLHLDSWVMGVIDKFEVRKSELVDVSLFGIQLQEREWMRNSFQLVLQRLDMIRIDVSVSKGVDELTALETTDLGEHASQQCITRDIEGNSKTQVTRSLVHLT